MVIVLALPCTDSFKSDLNIHSRTILLSCFRNYKNLVSESVQVGTSNSRTINLVSESVQVGTSNIILGLDFSNRWKTGERFHKVFTMIIERTH